MLRIIAGLIFIGLGSAGYIAMRRYKSTSIGIVVVAVFCVICGIVLLLSVDI